MIKNNLKLLASALGFILFFYACRTDEMVNSEQRTQNEKIQAFERFENLRSYKIQNSKISYSKGDDPLSVSYAQPFSEIIYNFLISHPDFQEKLFNDFGDIDYNVASQTFGTDKKYIFYPILKEGKVTALWYGKLNEDRSWVDFYLVNDSSASTQRMIGEFQAYYSKNTAARGASDPPVIEIPEIILTPPSTNPPIHDPIYVTGGGGGGDFPPLYTGDMSGGPMLHGGGTRTPDPCKKAKSILDNPALQDKVGTLKGKVNIDGANEFGFKVNMDGTTTNVTEGKKREWDVGSLQGIKGFYHSHPGPGINIFSPPDIQSLFTNIITSGSPSTVSDIFIGVIGSENYSGGIKYFHYIVRYNGSIQEAGAISSTNYDMKTIINNYQKREYELTSMSPASLYSDNDGATLNHQGVEQLFFDTLGKMGIDKNKMILQRVDDNGSVNTIALNSDETTTAIPCP